MLKTLISFILLIQMIIYSQSLGGIKGVVKDSLSGEPLIGVKILLLDTNYGSPTGPNGDYVINNIQDGIYRLKASYLGYKTIVIENIVVENNSTVRLNIELTRNPEIKIIPIDSASISFWFYPLQYKLLTQYNLLIEYRDNRFQYTIEGENFFTDEEHSIPHTIGYETSRNEFASLTFSFQDNNIIISEGSLQLPLRMDWGWGVSFHIDNKNPAKTCFGCLGYKVFPINKKYRESENDSLYVIWGGNSISSPGIY